ncbi:MAG TPA: TIGR03435 family protein [Granulicella sp.]|nr:TIGR03435 family protein [Granulicella sp.]
MPLSISKGGPKPQASKGDRPPGYRVYVGPGRLEGLNWSMQNLATMLQPAAGMPVVDKTGVAGGYNIKFDFAADSDSSLPSLFTALRESLGLKLKAQKVPVAVIVIDHVDRAPTPS